MQRKNDCFVNVIQESKLLILSSIPVIKFCAKWYPYSQCACLHGSFLLFGCKTKKQVTQLKKYA